MRDEALVLDVVTLMNVLNGSQKALFIYNVSASAATQKHV